MRESARWPKVPTARSTCSPTRRTDACCASPRARPELPAGVRGNRPQGELALPRQVDRLAKDAQRLVGRVETGRVLGFDEVHVELRLPLEALRLAKAHR